MAISQFTRYLKILILFSLFSFSSFSLFAQDYYEEDDKEINDEYYRSLPTISYYGENNFFVKKGTFAYNFGLRLDIQKEIFGFYYKLGAGVNPEGKLYGHIPLG